MARIARVVAPGYPHHVTQRGNRRLQTFFIDDDYEAYIDLAAQWCSLYNVEVWSYCLMPNHVHLIVVPDWKSFIGQPVGDEDLKILRKHERTGKTGGK